mmetsp:Transcript_10704/g.13334  ORF Transcript_10704/g.13334 Transcript_10704/m.13334 type:complete len:114 (+) Transcript_10704:223-564(+)
MQSEAIAKAFLNGEERVLVSCDFSTAMVTRMKERYAQSKFTAQAGNKAIIDTETDYADPTNSDRVDLESVINAQKSDGFSDRLVLGFLADNMRLPFADGVFEAYISNLSLMIV